MLSVLNRLKSIKFPRIELTFCDWVLVLTYVLLFLLFGSAHYLSNQEGESQSSNGASQEQHESARHRVVEVVEPPYAPQSEPNSEWEHWRQQKDLEAQTSMARWAWWTMVASFVSVFTAGIGVILVLRTLREQRRATDAAVEATAISQKQLIASQRAWIKADVRVVEDITIRDDQVRMKFLFVLKNVGNYPASDVLVDAKLSNLIQDGGKPGFSGTDPKPIMEAMIHDAILRPSIEFSDFLFPIDEGPRIVELSLKKPPSADFFGGKSIWPHLICCISYKSSPHNQTHVMAFVREIRKIDNSDMTLHYQARLRTIDIEEIPIPISNVHIGRSVWAADKAN